MNPTDEELAEILDELDKQTSAWLAPMQIIRKVNPFVIWGIFLALIFVLPRVGLNLVMAPVIIFYLIIVIYSWTIDFIYDSLHGRKKVSTAMAGTSIKNNKIGVVARPNILELNA